MIANAWIIPLLPLLAAAVVALLGRRVTRLAGGLTASAVFFSLVISLKLLILLLANPRVNQMTWPWLQSAGQLALEAGLLVDPLSAMMLVIVSFVSLMIQVYSLGYMSDDPDRPRYFAYLSLFTFSMLGLVLANNLVLMYMFWELVGLCSYLLIGFWYQKPEAANAGKKAFIVTRFGDLGFLIGILLIGHLLNTFNIAELGQAVQAGKLTGGLATTVALLLFAGAVGKSAQFPLHIWLPDAMEGPTPVSALIHAATMVAAGVFMVARLFPLFTASPDALTVISYIGGGTAFLAATMACVQNDIKRILAYSTVSQLGYMMLALGCGGYTAGIFHLLTHGAFKALLFLAAGSVIHAVHTNRIWDMGGLGRTMKITSLVTLVGALALAGVFPFAGFFSKDAVLLAVAHSGRLDLLVIGLLTALITSFYIFRLFFTVFTQRPAAGKSGHESPLVMTLPMLLLALISTVLGFWAEPIQQFLGQSLGAAAAEAGHDRLIPLLAFIAACFGFGWAYLVYYQRAVSAALLARRFSWLYELLVNQYYIDAAYQWLVRRLLFAFSRVLAWFDRNVVDGAVNGVAWLCRQTGSLLRLVQVGRLSAYLLALVLGLLIMAVTVLLTQSAVLALP
ncbi:MAG: NADH-quinone oxidoreductase subunit L [candidate division FCPU426 bacterium]